MSTIKIPVTREDHYQGPENALVTLVEYGDYECPYCGMAYPIVKQIQKYYGNKLLFVFRNFPLTEVHPHAEMAAETAEFANDYGRFWEMHDLLYENQNRLNKPFLLYLCEKLELPTNELDPAIEKQFYAPKIKNDFLGGVRSGVNGTPTFFINNQRHHGSFEFEDLVAAIDAAS